MQAPFATWRAIYSEDIIAYNKFMQKRYKIILIFFILLAFGSLAYFIYPVYKKDQEIRRKCYNATIADSHYWGDQSMIQTYPPYQRCLRQKGDPKLYDLTDYGYIEDKNGGYYFVGVENAKKYAVKK